MQAIRILIADDDPIIRRLLSRCLEDLGYEVVVVKDGREALDALAGPFDLVVLDVDMPDVDGFDICRHMRSSDLHGQTPVLMITAYEDSGAVDRAYDAGATDFALKPINVSVFAHHVQFLLRAARALRDLKDSEERLARAQAIAGLGSWDWVPDEDAWTWSPALFNILGYDPSETAASREALLARFAPGDRALVGRDLALAAAGDSVPPRDVRFLRPDGFERIGTIRLQSRRETSGALRVEGVLHDITKRKLAEQRLHYLAFFDELTGLPNRKRFEMTLRRRLVESREAGTEVALMLLEIDNYYHLTGLLGYRDGDLIIMEMAGRLGEVEDELWRRPAFADTQVFRIDTRSFAIVLPGSDARQRARELCERFIEPLGRPVQIGDYSLSLDISIGVAVFPTDGTDRDDLIRHANAALLEARASGVASFVSYSPELHERLARELAIERSLSDAMARGQMYLLYQPKVDLATRTVQGVEALLRWRMPELGEVPPNEFIPVAERTNQIIPLGREVLAMALSDISAWRRAGGFAVEVAVNLSRNQLTDRELVRHIEALLDRTGLPAKQLRLEVTESSLFADAELAQRFLSRLRDLGVHMSLDDFGTGYSSLADLARMPIDEVKIDRSFITALDRDANLEALTATIISMAHTLGMRAVAEGVERPSQLAILEDLGCDEVQGYFFSRPVPLAQLRRDYRETGRP